MSSITSAYKLQIENLENKLKRLILENKRLKSYLSEGPIWGETDHRDIIGDPNTAYVSTEAEMAQPNQTTSTHRQQTQLGFAASRGNQNSNAITPEQYTAHAYQVIMGIMQDAVDQGIIDSSMLSQLAGQAYSTWVAGGPSALANFLNQNNIPFQQN